MAEADLPDELLARFLSGEASAADRVAVEQWAARDPGHRAQLEQLLAATARREPGQWDVDRAWGRVEQAIRAPAAPATVLPMRRASWGSILLRAAAAVAVVFGVIFAWRQLGSVAQPVVYATSLGERLEVNLPDGSLAVLGPWSTLTVPVRFGTGERRVTLDGEGWFHAADDSLSFEVQAGEFLVRDIGTVFTVVRRADTPLRVMVVEGEVQVRVAADTTLLASLSTGDVGEFDRPDPALEPEAVIAHEQPVEALASWRTGTLDVVDAPVQQVLDRLAAWHGVTISAVQERVRGRTITATIPLDSLDDALEIVATLIDADVLRSDGTVRLQ